MFTLKDSVTLDRPIKLPALSVSKIKRTFKRGTVGLLDRKRVTVTDIFGTSESLSVSLPATTQEDPPAMDFPGTTRHVVAQEALEHLEQNLSTFTKIFAEFHIPTSDYRLLAGFNENLLRGHVGFLQQIHVIILSEPADMSPFLSRLLPALGQFTAMIFTNKSTYHLPSALPHFTEIARVSTQKTAHALPSCLSLSSNVGTGGGFSVGAPSGQGSNEKDGSRGKKGKEREDPDKFIPDPSKEGKGDGDPKSPGPERGEARDAQITFQVTTHLCQRSDPSFQDLKVRGILTTKRVPELQDPARFATCELEFTEILTSTSKTMGDLQYHQFQLVVEVNAMERRSLFTKVRPVSTPKYGPQSKVSNTTKNAWNSVVSGMLTLLKPQIGASAGRSGEQTTGMEHTLNISRVIQADPGPVNSWAFHIADPFEQEAGLPLPPDKLPFMHIEFYGSPVPPPPTHLDVAISTYWSLLSPPQGGNTWLIPKTTAPTFSNLCEIISLHLPSDLQGSHIYTADLLVWPKKPDTNSLMYMASDEYQGNVGILGKLGETRVVETGLDIN